MIDCTKNKNNEICKRIYREGEFKIIIPKNDNNKRPIDRKILQKYISKVNHVFGGSTTHPTTLGCYFQKEKNEMYCEEGFAITAVRDFNGKYTPNKLQNLSPNLRMKQLRKDYERLKSIAKEAGDELGQDSVMVSFDDINDATFVSGKYKDSLPQDKLKDNTFQKEV